MLTMETFNRTRFLADLDHMLMMDRNGAVADMLQVLRETGVIKQAFATKIIDNYLEDAERAEGYREHMKREIAHGVGHLLLNDGVLRFKETPESPDRTLMTCSAFFVVP